MNDSRAGWPRNWGQVTVPALGAALTVADELADMVRRKATTTLADWRAKAEASGAPELARFAASLGADAAAVSAALTGPWSNGPVEGQAGRRKAIKRSMFGRCGLDLLRARVMRKGRSARPTTGGNVAIVAHFRFGV